MLQRWHQRAPRVGRWRVRAVRHEADPWSFDSDEIVEAGESSTAGAPLLPVVLEELGVDDTVGTSAPQFAPGMPDDPVRRVPGAHRFPRHGARRPVRLVRRHRWRREFRYALVLLAAVAAIVLVSVVPHQRHAGSSGVGSDTAPRLPGGYDTLPAPLPPVAPTDHADPSPSDAASPATSAGRPSASGRPAGSADTVPVLNPAPGPPARYQAVRGPGCPGDGYTETGAYRYGQVGWYWKGAGGWTGDGCTGTLAAVPMSGDAEVDDPTARVRWSFDIHPVVHGSCAVSIYVPSTNDWRDAAGNPAFYDVAAGSGGPPTGTFTIDQLHSPGVWVTAGSFNVNAAALAITLHTRGIDWNDYGPTYAHLAAAQVRVRCTAIA